MPKIEMGKKYRTRGGDEVKLYAVLEDAPNYQRVHGAVRHNDQWDIEWWDECGKAEGFATPRDLLEIPEEVTGWLNIDDDETFLYNYYRTKDRADQCKSEARIACIPITYHKGQGLEDNKK